MPDIHSFDVFDTCITRTYSEPADLFLELARVTLLQQFGIAEGDEITMLAKQRIIAESDARRRSSREEIQLTDIYTELSRLRETSFDAQSMLSTELALELESIVQIPSTFARYREYQSAGHRIIFISDMYLPVQTVLTMLNKCGYEATDDNLYLSGDIGLKKRSGKLYTHVLQTEDVPPASIIHHGDNLVSDIRMAKAQGLKTVHVSQHRTAAHYASALLHKSTLWQNISDKMQKLSRFYRNFYHSPASRLSPEKQVALSRVSAAASILLRKQCDRDSSNDHLYAIGYFVAAPLFTSYVLWLLNTARDNGIKKLYFVARNGQIFHRLAEKICRAGGYDIELRYLYGSRAAWYPSSFESFDADSIALLVKKYPKKTVGEIFEDLGFPATTIATLLAAVTGSCQGDSSATDEIAVRAVLEWLSKSEHSEAITEQFASSWRNIADYLSQEQVFDQVKFGIVDIGWHLSSHNALHKILRRVGKGGFSGFYFGVGRRRQEVADEAPYFAFVSDVASRRHSWLFKLGAMSLLEEVFAAADHPTTSGYYREGDRVFPQLNSDSPTKRSRIAEIVQEAILAFADFMLERGTIGDLSLATPEFLTQFERLYKYPTADEARAMADTPIYALTSHSLAQKRTLAHSIRTGELLQIITNVLFQGRNISPEWVWLPGSMAMSNGFVAVTGKLLSFLESFLLRLRS